MEDLGIVIILFMKMVRLNCEAYNLTWKMFVSCNNLTSCIFVLLSSSVFGSLKQKNRSSEKDIQNICRMLLIPLVCRHDCVITISKQILGYCHYRIMVIRVNTTTF